MCAKSLAGGVDKSLPCIVLFQNNMVTKLPMNVNINMVQYPTQKLDRTLAAIEWGARSYPEM